MQLNEHEFAEYIRKQILKEYEDDVEDSEFWNSFDEDEFEGEAQKAARYDIEKSGEKFVPIGKSEFEKNINPKDFKRNISQANMRLPSDEKELQNIQQSIDARKKHNKTFGAGRLNEDNETSDLSHPFYIKDAEGKQIKITNTVKDVKTGAIGNVEQFGEDANNNPCVYVNWIHGIQNGVPNREISPTEIIVTQSRPERREVDEDIKDIMKYPNLRADSSLNECLEVLKIEKKLLEATLISENEPSEDVKKKQGLMNIAGFPFVVYFIKDEHKGYKIQFIPSTWDTLEKIDMVGRDNVAEKIKEEIVKLGVSNPVYNPEDEAAGIVFLTHNPKFGIFDPAGKPHDMKYDFSLNEMANKKEKEAEKLRNIRKGARRDAAIESGEHTQYKPKVIPDKKKQYKRKEKHPKKDWE